MLTTAGKENNVIAWFSRIQDIDEFLRSFVVSSLGDFLMQSSYHKFEIV